MGVVLTAVAFITSYYRGFILSDFIFLSIIGLMSLSTLAFFLLYSPYKSIRPSFGEHLKSLEVEFSEEILGIIGDNFEKSVIERLYFEDFNLINFEGVELCRQLLNEPQALHKDELRFALLVKLAKYYSKDDQYEKAIESLQKALEIYGDRLVPTLRLADAYEAIGSGSEALKFYEKALLNQEITDDLRPEIEVQINRVRQQWPTKRPSSQGFKWMAG